MASAIHTVTVYIDGDLRRMRLNYDESVLCGASLHGITAMLCYSGRRNLVRGLVSLISSPCMARRPIWSIGRSVTRGQRNAKPTVTFPACSAALSPKCSVRLLLICQ